MADDDTAVGGRGRLGNAPAGPVGSQPERRARNRVGEIGGWWQRGGIV